MVPPTYSAWLPLLFAATRTRQASRPGTTSLVSVILVLVDLSRRNSHRCSPLEVDYAGALEGIVLARTARFVQLAGAARLVRGAAPEFFRQYRRERRRPVAPAPFVPLPQRS